MTITEHDINLFWKAIDETDSNKIIGYRSLCFTERGRRAIANILAQKEQVYV